MRFVQNGSGTLQFFVPQLHHTYTYAAYTCGLVAALHAVGLSRSTAAEERELPRWWLSRLRRVMPRHAWYKLYLQPSGCNEMNPDT